MDNTMMKEHRYSNEVNSISLLMTDGKHLRRNNECIVCQIIM